MTVARRTRRRLAPLALTVAVFGSLLVAPTAANAAGTASISGTVVDQGSTLPIQGITVTLWNSDLPLTNVANTSTDENGQYSLSGLDAGTYKLSFTGVGPTENYRPAWYPSGTFFPDATPFALADAETLVADAELVTEATIQGTVMGADGPTADQLFVQAWEEDGGEYTSVGGDLVDWDTNPVSWEIDLLPGTYVLNFSDQRPDGPGTYRTEVYDNVFAFEDGVEITVVSSQVFDVPQVTMTTLGPVANERLSGANRYETAVAVSQQFDSFEGASGSYVYVASGANYPDALSAGPAAAFRDAPLLLTEGGSLPTAVRNELIRLEPETVIIAGGSAVVSNSVRSAIDAVVDTVVRIGGANRYETSRLLVEDAFPSASDAFIATGANFPDALAATAAAAQKSAPVILVDGTASSVNSATRALIGSAGLGVTDVYIAGGTAVVSNGVKSSLEGIDSVSSVTRLGGADRYATSFLINSEVFVTQNIADDPNAFFAVGTGFADALAGAALAGAQNPAAPLFTVPRTCVPTDVLDLFATMKVEKIWLLGGTAVLTNGVRDLTAC